MFSKHYALLSYFSDMTINLSLVHFACIKMTGHFQLKDGQKWNTDRVSCSSDK